MSMETGARARAFLDACSWEVSAKAVQALRAEVTRGERTTVQGVAALLTPEP